MSTEKHYQTLLGLPSPWEVREIETSVEELRVDVYVGHSKGTFTCPECGEACPIYDHSAERTWKHLDTMQFETFLHCEPPRVQCPEHGVKSVALPWAARHSRFTLLFEAFAIRVLEASRSVEEAGGLLKLNWQQLRSIMERAVQRGLERRRSEEVPWLGMDEKSFRKGHNYISVMSDLEGGRVIEVVEGRSGEAANTLITKALDRKQREMVCGVSIDMSAPYIKAIREHLPHADIVHDKFHIAKHLGEAVDKTRRKEHAKLLKAGDKTLTGTKYLWLKGKERLEDEGLSELEALAKSEQQVAKAWYLKELFTHFWTRRDRDYARKYFEYWEKEVHERALPEMLKVARMLKKHLANILTYFESFITNAVSEGLNSRIQMLKANARGFRNFANYRTTILFFCGKLNLHP